MELWVWTDFGVNVRVSAGTIIYITVPSCCCNAANVIMVSVPAVLVFHGPCFWHCLCVWCVYVRMWCVCVLKGEYGTCVWGVGVCMCLCVRCIVCSWQVCACGLCVWRMCLWVAYIYIYIYGVGVCGMVFYIYVCVRVCVWVLVCGVWCDEVCVLGCVWCVRYVCVCQCVCG